MISSPAVANGVVYLDSYNGYVYALNARTGAHLWSFENCCFYPRVQSSPAVSNGVVYFQDDDRIYAFGLK